MLIELKNIQKTYNTKTGVSFRAISNVSLTFDETGMVFLLGKSGSGKTTLLNLIGGMDSTDSGAIYIGGKNLARLKTAEVDSYRNTMVGFVFQEFNLIDYMTVFENVRLALDMQSDKDDGKVERALEQVDLLDKKYEKVENLSGGQRQRVGIARAIVKNPEIILADEPTGALDSATGEEVMRIFERLSKEKLVIMVSHDAEKAVAYADRIVEMKDGTIYRDVRRKKEGEKIDYNQIHITSNTLIRLEKGVTLKDGEVEQINEILNQKGRRAYINVDTNPQKIKALFPNLREAVDGGDSQKQDKNKSSIDTGEIITGKEGFVPYKSQGGEIKNIDFKKSNLPTHKALKIGLKNLRLKVAKMVITVVIAVLAFALFATAISFQGYDLTTAYAKTIKKSNYDYIMAINAAGTNYRITDDQIDSIKQANPKIGVYNQYKSEFATEIMNYYHYMNFYFNSFIETDDAADLKLEMLVGESALSDYDSVIISQAAAREYVRFGGMEGVSDYADLIGKEIGLSKFGENMNYYKVAGIFKSNLDKYKSDTQDQMLYNDIQNYIEGVLIAKTGFRQYLASTSASNGNFFISLSHTQISYTEHNSFNIMSNDTTSCKENLIAIDYNIESYFPWGGYYNEETGEYHETNKLDDENFELEDNQIFVTEHFLRQCDLYVPENNFEDASLTKVKDFNADPDRGFEIVSPYSGERTPYYFSSDVEIKGIIRGGNGNVDVIVSENVLKQVAIQQMYTYKVLIALSDNNKADTALISYLHGNGYKVESNFAVTYDTLLGFVSIFSTVIIVVSLLLCLLVVVLLFTFISSSIKLTRKQIGILRALGARRIDTFKIYALEGLVIGIISFAIATALLLIFAPVINALISVGLGYYLSALTIGIKDILAIFALMLCVTIVSILIPLRKFNKITPIKAIVEKE